MSTATAATGALARRGGDRTPLRTAGTRAAGTAAVHALGVPYLALATGTTLAEAAAVGLMPFLLGDALKIALAMGALPAAWHLLGRR